MGTGLKVFLWIVVILVVVIGGIVGIGIYVGTQSRESVEEAAAFAETATKTECLDELSRRSTECEGRMCVIKNSLFGMICLGGAEGEHADLCNYDVPVENLVLETCDAVEENDYCEPIVTASLSGYCGQGQYR